jgi:putative inorganic carbon (hco3(-)) transporter
VTQRLVSPLAAGLLLGAALVATALALGATAAGGTGENFGRLALVFAVLPIIALAFAARPAWPLSGGLALAMFNGNWGALGIGVPLDRALLLTGITTTLVRESRARGRLATRPIDWLLMLVALYVVCSSILAGTIDEGDARFALLDRFGLVPFLLFYVAGYAFQEARDRDVLLGVLVAMGLYLGFTAVMETIPLRAAVLPDYIDDPMRGIHFERARGPFLEATGNGMVLYACGIAAVIGFLRWRHPTARTIAAFTAGLCALGVLLTLTRAAWLSAVLATLITLLAYRETRRWAFPVIAASAVLVVGAFVASPSLYEHATERQNDQTPLWDRRNAASAAVRMIDDRPLFGFGWGRFESDSRDYFRQSPDYPLTIIDDAHNVYLSNASELGLVGAALWLVALLLAVGGGVLRRGPPALRPWRIGLLALGVAYLVAAYATPLEFTLPTLLLWTWAGLCWSDRR